MLIARFELGGREVYGEIKGSEAHEIEGDIFGEFHVTGRNLPLDTARLMAPVKPSKIIAIGWNYADHAVETKSSLPEEPLVFFKAPSAVIAHGQTIVVRSERRTDYEGELAIVIKDVTKDVSESEASRHILGYTCLNDVSDRVLQKKDVQFCRAKSMDTFCPMGPHIATGLDPAGLRIETRLNGEVRQSANTSQMVFGPFHLVSFLSHYMTLMPGDVIATGTPAGVGPVSDGDVVEVTIEGIGTLRNPVAVRF